MDGAAVMGGLQTAGQPAGGCETESRLGGMADGIPPEMDGHSMWAKEPAQIPYLISDPPANVAKRLKTLGNAVVPPQVFLAVVGTLITLLISAMCGYALAIYRFEIKYVNLVFGVFLLGTLIPGETLTVPQFSVISAMGLYNNIWGVILPVVTTTTGIFMYRQHYMSLPLSLVEAARIDGASEWKIFSNIMLPLGSNVTITLTIFSFMWRWNDYILPLLVLSDQKKYTIQIAIKNFIGNTGVDWSSILAASVLSILPIVILFVILQKYIVGGVSAGGVKG